MEKGRTKMTMMMMMMRATQISKSIKKISSRRERAMKRGHPRRSKRIQTSRTAASEDQMRVAAPRVKTGQVKATKMMERKNRMRKKWSKKRVKVSVAMTAMEARMIRLSYIKARLQVSDNRLFKRMQTLTSQQMSERARGSLRKDWQKMVNNLKNGPYLKNFTNVIKIFLRSMRWLFFALKVTKR